MKTLIILILCSILIFGCSTSNPIKNPESDTFVYDPIKDPVQTDVPIEEPIEEPVKTNITKPEENYYDRVRQEFISQTDKVKSYTYQDYDNKNTYYIKGDLMRVVLFKPVLDPIRYDTIYYDRSKALSFDQCTSVRDCKYEETRTYRIHKYKYIKTPIDFANSMKTGVLNEIDTNIIEGAKARSINFTNPQGNEVIVWMHNTYAIPLRIITKNNETETVVR